MASSYPSAVQVGSYFVGQYYQVLQQQPDLVHQFYSETSSMIRVDGENSDSASAMLEIHTLIMSMNFTAIEIKTLNSLDSWNGCVLVVVTGSVKAKDFIARRNFVQTFLLAPQEKGFFVLNDIFQYIDDEPIYQHQAPILSENNFDSQLNASSPRQEQLVSDYVLEEDASEYVSNVHIEDDPVDKYSIPEPQQQQHQDVETEVVVEESPVEETSASVQNVVTAVQENPSVTVEEPVEEPVKKTWASILRKGQPASLAAPQPSFVGTQTSSDWNYTPQYTEQQPISTYTSVPDSVTEAAEESFVLEEEGEPKSVYVRNLPPDVTEDEIEQEFKNFGRIRPDGVFIRSRKDIGVCYAFVEYEDLIGVHNALKASPIQLAGRQVYIEERRQNSSGVVARGGRRGRGRGGYQTESTRGRFGGRSLGRGSNQESDYNRLRGNGFHQRGSR
ncbi:Putative G3BP-like protein [Morus notabilis]|uniref:Putative G3BP-like protein n=1 Tax=Morus notabilis TaxID=981085 RepID=W9QZK7_9ROSA|nr:ras GTPase-activating protein-binding protein 1 isoform X1 [Morus notabilis]EXB46009.1 Putative G3BP-like protein [Morus notabilis]